MHDIQPAVNYNVVNFVSNPAPFVSGREINFDDLCNEEESKSVKGDKGHWALERNRNTWMQNSQIQTFDQFLLTRFYLWNI